MRAAAAVAIGLMSIAPAAEATYSPPLNRVRIDRDRSNHSPMLLWADEERSFVAGGFELGVLGAQYLGQLEWESGFGIQAGLAIGRVGLQGTLRSVAFDAGGVFTGGQLRVYQMLWSGGEGARPHALTAFVNLRAVYYFAEDAAGRSDRITLELFNLTGGVGLMAELSLFPWLSFCPYAWLTPGVTSTLAYDLGGSRFDADGGPNLRTPLLFGADLWIYPLGVRDDAHFSLSVLASLIDTSGDGNRLVSGVLGYTL
jgi:hypothetical protein